MSAGWSPERQAVRDRLLTKLYDACVTLGALSAGDPDAAVVRRDAENEAAGRFDPDYIAAVIAIRREGCQCKVKLSRVDGGAGYDDEHEPHCQVLRNREMARAGMAPPIGPPRDAHNPLGGTRTPLADSPRGRLLDRITGGGRR